MRRLIGEASIGLLWLIYHAWGRRWISTATCRRLATAVMRATIDALRPSGCYGRSGRRSKARHE